MNVKDNQQKIQLINIQQKSKKLSNTKKYNNKYY